MVRRAEQAPSSIPPERIAAYDRLIAGVPGLARKGAGVPYTSVNGHMSSYLGATGSLALRLPPAERAAFLERDGASLQVAYGTVQPEFVAVPDALLEDTAELAPWFAAGHAWVAARQPKSTTRTARRTTAGGRP